MDASEDRTENTKEADLGGLQFRAVPPGRTVKMNSESVFAVPRKPVTFAQRPVGKKSKRLLFCSVPIWPGLITEDNRWSWNYEGVEGLYEYPE